MHVLCCSFLLRRNLCALVKSVALFGKSFLKKTKFSLKVAWFSFLAHLFYPVLYLLIAVKIGRPLSCQGYVTREKAGAAFGSCHFKSTGEKQCGILCAILIIAFLTRCHQCLLQWHETSLCLLKIPQLIGPRTRCAFSKMGWNWKRCWDCMAVWPREKKHENMPRDLRIRFLWISKINAERGYGGCL